MVRRNWNVLKFFKWFIVPYAVSESVAVTDTCVVDAALSMNSRLATF
jgi:hypothetical protein